jgi:hypothetical protein
MLSKIRVWNLSIYLITPDDKDILRGFDTVDTIYRKHCNSSGMLSGIKMYLRTKSGVIVEISTPLHILTTPTIDITKVLDDIRTKVCWRLTDIYDSILGVIVFTVDKESHNVVYNYTYNNNGIHIRITRTGASESYNRYNGFNTRYVSDYYQLKISDGNLVIPIEEDGICYGYLMLPYDGKWYYHFGLPSICELVVGISKPYPYTPTNVTIHDRIQGIPEIPHLYELRCYILDPDMKDKYLSSTLRIQSKYTRTYIYTLVNRYRKNSVSYYCSKGYCYRPYGLHYIDQDIGSCDIEYTFGI